LPDQAITGEDSMNTIVKQITFARDLTDNDFKGMQEMLGHKIVQEGTRHIVVAFDDCQDYMAFLVATGQVKMTQASTGKNILEL
jgi:hypothetical protein